MFYLNPNNFAFIEKPKTYTVYYIQDNKLYREYHWDTAKVCTSDKTCVPWNNGNPDPWFYTYETLTRTG